MIRTNSREFEADGRVLRLKQYMNSDARPPMIDMVLNALEVNTRVEALYIQNFELVRLARKMLPCNPLHLCPCFLPGNPLHLCCQAISDASRT